jgi:Tfp pilus assembly protein PilX
MKHKSSLLLMEQLIMVLVFALAAALCLQVFAKADRISLETTRQDRAMILAQNAAAVLKATEGNIEKAEAFSQDGYQVDITKLPGVSGLGCAQIQISYEGTPLFTLQTGWQEGAP